MVDPSRNEWTRISFDLPYMISVDDGVYEVIIQAVKSRVYLTRIQRGSGGGFQVAGGTADLEHDTLGRFAYTSVTVELPGHISDVESRHDEFFNSFRNPLVEKALVPLNRLIQIARNVTGRFSLRIVRYADVLKFNWSYLDGIHETSGGFGVSTGTGGIRLSSGPIQYSTPEQKQEIARIMQAEEQLELGTSFLMDAKNALLDENYALATVLGVIALEVAVSHFATTRGSLKGLNREQISDLLRDMGLKASLDVVLKLLKNDNDPALNIDVLGVCAGAITVRNNVVHRGLREVYRGETQKRIIAIDSMITYLRFLLNAAQ